MSKKGPRDQGTEGPRGEDKDASLNPRSLDPSVPGSLASLRLLIFDVDGVLTDGAIIVNDLGQESKRFYVRDGFAIKFAMSLGLKVGVITGRSSRSVSLRMTELGVPYYMPGSKDKLVALETVCQQAGVLP